MDLKDKVILITGASGGIGAALARELAGKEAILLLAARNKDKLKHLEVEIGSGEDRVYSYPVDLLEEAERIRLISRIHDRFGKIDILINNAGSGWYGYGYTLNWQDAKAMVELNITALVHLSLLVLTEMKNRKAGHIINISSIAGSFPIQGAALYGASKAFVDNFSMALYREMRGTGVSITVIKPAAVRTEFFKNAAARINGMEIPGQGTGMHPAKVSKRILSVLRKPRKRIVIPGVLSLLPAVEIIFGWIIDLFGPVLLKNAGKKA